MREIYGFPLSSSKRASKKGFEEQEFDDDGVKKLDLDDYFGSMYNVDNIKYTVRCLNSSFTSTTSDYSDIATVGIDDGDLILTRRRSGKVLITVELWAKYKLDRSTGEDFYGGLPPAAGGSFIPLPGPNENVLSHTCPIPTIQNFNLDID